MASPEPELGRGSSERVRTPDAAIKETIQSPQSALAPDHSSKRSSGRSRRSHRRTHSEELLPGYQKVYYDGRGSPAPPNMPVPQKLPSPRVMDPYNASQSRPSSGSGSRRSRRTRSSSNPVGKNMFEGLPPSTSSPSGYMYQMQQGGYNQGAPPMSAPPERRSKGKGDSGNRTRTSPRDGHPIPPPVRYGSFEGYARVNAPPPPIHTHNLSRNASPTANSDTATFSPRSEMMNLVGSPSRNASASFSPLPPAHRSQSFRGTRLFREPADSDSDDMYGGGDEYPENFTLASNQRNDKHGAKSLRKMHMRQQSVNLYVEDIKGTIQPRSCRDFLFALLFILHLIGMAYVGSTYSYEAIGSFGMKHPETVEYTGAEDNEPVKLAYKNIIFVVSLCGAFAMLLSALTFALITIFARKVVQVALFAVIGLSFAWGTIGIGISPKNIVPITGIIALALSVGYTFVVWDRIPFASANLLTALSAIRANPATVVITFFFQSLSLIWSIYVTFVVIGVYDAIETKDLVLSGNMHILAYSMLGLSYYWTYHVLLNIVQVAVAGIIGFWWSAPTGTGSFCDGTVSKNLFLACTTSFGSICFGSLLVGPVQMIRQLSVFIRPNHDGDSVLMCLHECLIMIQTCIVNRVDSLASTFSPWAYTYVGLYGYGLLEGGSNATALFERRGWTKIVMDDLIPNVLKMVALVIGGVTGCFGYLIESVDQLHFTNIRGNDPGTVAFLIGLMVGLVVTTVLFGIISSSVNAVIVSFAGNPVEFEKCHPELSQEMRASWGEVWPGCMEVTDLTVALSQGLYNNALESHPLV